MRRPPLKRPLAIAEILESILKRRGLGKKLKQYSLFEIWNELVGPLLAKQTRPKRMQGNTLIVTAKSASWVQELFFMKPFIIKKIEENIPGAGITDIRFIVGTF